VPSTAASSSPPRRLQPMKTAPPPAACAPKFVVVVAPEVRSPGALHLDANERTNFTISTYQPEAVLGVGQNWADSGL
jgi:hypothetical protein